MVVSAYGETLHEELRLAGIPIRVTIVEAAGFRTKGVSGAYLASQRIPQWDKTREEAILSRKILEVHTGFLKGDPKKAMELCVDVIRGEGEPAKLGFPKYLPMGDQADRDIRAKVAERLKNLDDWGHIIKDLNFDEEDESRKANSLEIEQVSI